VADPKEEVLANLARELEDCAACHLRGECIAPVGWFGAAESPLVIVAEGPGGVEDSYGCPLIGPSGQLLDKALWSVGITRDRILTTNVIKCRPTGNRTPTIEEADFCAKRFLYKELDCLQPKVIVALGNVALHYLLGPDARISRARGCWFKTYQGFDTIATYHPSYLLRLHGQSQIAAKWDVFHDLQAAKAKALEAVPDYQFKSEKPYPFFKHLTRRHE
jgi:uracil-DNA glycosylase family 4